MSDFTYCEAHEVIDAPHCPICLLDERDCLQSELTAARDEAERLRGRVSAQTDALYSIAVALKDAGTLSREMHDTIVSATEGTNEAWLLRKQAEAVEKAARECMPGPCGPPDDPPAGYQEYCEGVASVRDYAQRLRQQADELEHPDGRP